jgi:Family of unknown function (DUF6515)
MHVISRGLWITGLTLLAFAAQAQVPEHGHGGGYGYGSGHPNQHYDVRYSHNYYYPARGVYVGAVPHGAVVITHPGGNYYYSSGIWYRPYGTSFIVVGAPIGVFVPVLPPYYTTVWVAGAPYYYANDTYYTWSQDQSGYQVVDPPSGPTTMAPPPPQGAQDPAASAPMPQPTDDLYAYPQAGQSAQQQASDKYECHKWATGQSGFDPTQSGGGVAPAQSDSARANYQRAMSACLEGRGYSVR